ncbi:STAS domain-containing protein [Nonomuraea dietziae]|uniref:Anti-sigma factor antagonist n=1 Tax=Nonomuraea dietziae TaxID=65515 RepID=A0A7W5V1M4_9ACTN|nr:STAS domain-containing protein [Nonomuraea dietziae]MBB3724189.1 stage II sporulation protein AA (anti-sigma F factor antagonist) [Nonomuraea dietziae]
MPLDQPYTVSLSLGLQGRCLIARLSGELDFNGTPMVRDRIARAIEAADPPLLIIDMADVTLCDSAGLSLFVSVHRSIKVLGGRLVVTGLQGRCLDVFTITGMTKLLDVRPTAEMAIDELNP